MTPCFEFWCYYLLHAWNIKIKVFYWYSEGTLTLLIPYSTLGFVANTSGAYTVSRDPATDSFVSSSGAFHANSTSSCIAGNPPPKWALRLPVFCPRVFFPVLWVLAPGWASVDAGELTLRQQRQPMGVSSRWIHALDLCISGSSYLYAGLFYSVHFSRVPENNWSFFVVSFFLLFYSCFLESHPKESSCTQILVSVLRWCNPKTPGPGAGFTSTTLGHSENAHANIIKNGICDVDNGKFTSSKI